MANLNSLYLQIQPKCTCTSCPPRYVKVLDIESTRSLNLHLVLSSRTYILSAADANAFDKWLAIFYQYAYGDVLAESAGWKQGEKKRSYKKAPYKLRYLVLTRHQQIRVYTDDQRLHLHSIVDLNDVHSFNIEVCTLCPTCSVATSCRFVGFEVFCRFHSCFMTAFCPK